MLRQSLETKTREQLLVEMDTKWRERVLEVYGKREEEFGGDEEAYNDYVEQREDLSKYFPSLPSALPTSLPHHLSLPSLCPFFQSIPWLIASSWTRTKSSSPRPAWKTSENRMLQRWQNTRRAVKVRMYRYMYVRVCPPYPIPNRLPPFPQRFQVKERVRKSVRRLL